MRVALDGTKLKFECTYEFEDTSYGGQKGMRSMTVTNSFQIPFEVSPQQIQVEGNKVIIKS